ncbi:MAG: TetR/AcrR family transcriptional regulator [Acidiferrobacterales bacterium]
MQTHSDLRERIVDTALALGEQRPWEAVRLHDVADALSISLNDVRQYFREKEELVDAWFDRADGAALEDATTAEFQALAPRERLHRAIMTWLQALAPHKKVTREMIYGKLEPGHLHVQIPGLLRISRTVQWFREAAHRDATFLRRALEETGLTTIYLITFFYWLRDDSAGATRTAALLDRLLGNAQRLSQSVFGSERAPEGESAERVPR